MSYTDATADTTFVYAPLAFFGDYAAEDVTAISFDHQIFAENNVISVAPYKIDLSGPGGTATWLGTTPSLATLPTGWINVSAPITDDASAPSGWDVTSGTWQGLMSDVTGFDIQIELVTNNQVPGWIDNEGIDNVTLTGTAASVPEPASFALLGAGLLSLAWCRLTPGTSRICRAV